MLCCLGVPLKLPLLQLIILSLLAAVVVAEASRQAVAAQAGIENLLYQFLLVLLTLSPLGLAVTRKLPATIRCLAPLLLLAEVEAAHLVAPPPHPVVLAAAQTIIVEQLAEPEPQVKVMTAAAHRDLLGQAAAAAAQARLVDSAIQPGRLPVQVETVQPLQYPGLL